MLTKLIIHFNVTWINFSIHYIYAMKEIYAPLLLLCFLLNQCPQTFAQHEKFQKTPYPKIFFDEKSLANKTDYLNHLIDTLPKDTKPNIIIILADDLGQTDISRYGNTTYQTPHIDQIGKNGVTFSEAYITSPVCSPSRAGLLTGRYQQRFGHEFQPQYRFLHNRFEYTIYSHFKALRPLAVEPFNYCINTEERLREGLPPSEITLAELLTKLNYQTAIIGKWHLGAAPFAQPCNRGFGYQYGFYEAYTLYQNKKDTNVVNCELKKSLMDEHQWKDAAKAHSNCAILRTCCETKREEEYLTDKLTDEAIAFINQNKEEPFFLYLPYNAPHAPLQAPNSYYEKFDYIKDPVKRIYAAMISNLDDNIGRLTQVLDSLHLSDNTIIFFLSDNGGATYNGTTDNAPFRGGKLTNFEGGIRIPFLMQWKNHLPENTFFNAPVISLDIFSTISEVLAVSLPTDRIYDGVNLLPYINGINNHAPHEALYWRSDYNKAIRMGEWKLIVHEKMNEKLLFNITNDKIESTNVATQFPAIVKQLENRLYLWEKQMAKPLWPHLIHYNYEDKEGKYYFAF